MVRPQDYGDQYPSDQDDVKPDSPTADFTQQDYTIGQPGDGNIPADSALTRTSGHDVGYAAPVKRTEYAGIILEKINDGSYYVLRQDGNRGIGLIISGRPRSKFNAGDDVLLVQTQNRNEYFILGDRRPYEMPQVVVSGSASPAVGVINHGTTVEQYPPAVLPLYGGDGELIPNGVGVEVVKKGVITIDFTVTVEHITEQTYDYTPMWVAWDCIDTSAPNDQGLFSKVGAIAFSAKSGIVVQTVGHVANVGFDAGPYPDVLLSQESGEGEPTWKQDVNLGGSLEVGTQVDHPWFKIGNVWQTGGDGDLLKVKWPNYVPSSIGDFMVVDNLSPVDNSCVRIGFMQKGGTGFLTTWQPNGYEYVYTNCCEEGGYFYFTKWLPVYYQVVNGILYGGNLAQNFANPTEVCESSVGQAPEFC